MNDARELAAKLFIEKLLKEGGGITWEDVRRLADDCIKCASVFQSAWRKHEEWLDKQIPKD